MGYIDSAGIRYCHWKSNIHLDAALNGETDLDILVDREDAVKILDVFNRLNIKQVTNPSHQQYPSISDFVGYDEASHKFIHIHLHFQVILGGSGMKEYHFPVEKMFFNNLRKKYDLCVPVYELELVLFIIRLSFKRTYYYILRLFVRNLVKTKRECEFVLEFDYLVEKIDPNNYRKLVEEMPIENSLKKLLIDISIEKAFPSKISSQKIVGMFSEFRRVTFAEGVFLKFYKAIYSKVIWVLKLNKKEPFSGGVSIAIVGVDGSGKTTLVNSLKKKLSWKFRVEYSYFGSNKYKSIFLWASVFPLLVLYKVFPEVKIFKKIRAYSWSIMEFGYFKQREKSYFRALHAKGKGSISICERYPMAGCSDWPFTTLDLKGEYNNAVVKNIKARLESRYEKRFRQPDLMIVLTADSATSYERKPDHSLKLLSDKHERMERFLAKNKNNKNIYIIDSSVGKENVLNEALKIIWDNL